MDLESEERAPTGVIPRLGLWDAVSIIVGIVVGTAIFRSPQLVFQNVGGPWQALGVWVLGGVLCLLGGFCYAELAAAYPRNGGDYEYLTRAYGRWVGFLFGWAQLAAILTGSIGAMGYAFADYAVELFAAPAAATAWIAAGAVALLTLVNAAGLALGKSVQNALSVAKIVGLVVVAAVGLAFGNAESLVQSVVNDGATVAGFGMAMVFVLYAYGGWNDAVFVAAEVRDVQRNMPRALVLGISGITLIYVAVNAAYLAVLGFETARDTPTPAAAVLQAAVGPWGAKAISVLVMISALGAINGLILAGSRLFATVGEDHALFAWLGKWNRRAAAPVAAVMTQGAVALAMIVAVGTSAGRGAIDVALNSVGAPGLPWDKYFGGFDTLVAATAPVFWAFFLLSGVSLFVLRWTDSERPRPFRTPWYPLPPLVFCATSVYMLYSSISYAGLLSLLGAAPLALGVVLYAMQPGAKK